MTLVAWITRICIKEVVLVSVLIYPGEERAVQSLILELFLGYAWALV